MKRSVSRSVRRSFHQFRSNPLRTLLTLLGIVFGVGSVVGMVSVGEGAQQEILAAIEAMGATTTHIRAREISESELGNTVAESPGLSRSDVLAFAQSLPQVESLGYRARLDLRATDLPVAPADVELLAVSPDLFEVHNLQVSAGRPLVSFDDRYMLRTGVLGADLAQRCFGDDAIGQRIRIDYTFFEVVGVLAGRAAGGEDLPLDPEIYDNAILVPFATAQEELRPVPAYGELDLVSLRVASTEQTLELKRALEPLLAGLHEGIEDYEIIAPEEILRQRQAAQQLLNAVLVSIAAISLVVGGIGIMNIMLANIMERISEIGLRRAVGANRDQIRNQFLLEAVLVCAVGGLLGLVLGLTLGLVVSRVAGFPFAFAWESMVLAFSISVAVGVVFGLVPAIRAANIDPIEALHSE